MTEKIIGVERAIMGRSTPLKKVEEPESDKGDQLVLTRRLIL